MKRKDGPVAPDDPRTPLEPGETVVMDDGGRYLIGDCIGRGGFSLVYAARPAGASGAEGYDFVLKEFFPRRAATDPATGAVVPLPNDEAAFNKARERFRRESGVGRCARGASYQAVALLGYGSEENNGGNAYALMLKKSGDTLPLKDLLREWDERPPAPGPDDRSDPLFTDLFRVKLALGITDDLLAALRSLHERELLHLDVNDSNVWYAGADHTSCRNGAVLLCDFGSSGRMENGAAFGAETHTAYYSAPEQRSASHPLSPSSDLYAAGVLLLKLCTGNIRPFLGRDLPGGAEKRVRAAVSLLRLPQDTAEGLSGVITGATKEKPEERAFQSAREMSGAVRRLESGIEDRLRGGLTVDRSADFNLRDLKAMLYGADATGYDWAASLCRRRRMTDPDAARLLTNFRQHIAKGILTKGPAAVPPDESFLSALLPPLLLSEIEKEKAALRWLRTEDVMTGLLPNELTSALKETDELQRRTGIQKRIRLSGSLSESRFTSALSLLMKLEPQGSPMYRALWRLKLKNGDCVSSLAELAWLALTGP